MKNVLITGGSRGIGAEMVRAFSRAGYAVAFTYKSSAAAAGALAEECGALAIAADSMSESDIADAVRRVREELGDIYCLINNAAVSSFSLLTDLSTQAWNETLGVSLTGAFMYSRLVIPDMLRLGEGRIINISSMWGITGASCEVHYSAAKAGLIGLTRALAKELGPSHITVNAIAPGVIDTDMNSSLDGDTLRELVDGTPLMRLGTPADVASAALFLAGEGASFITGDVLNVSGGFVI
ncbi:MAG: SDR family oxidoreductase [Clostridia bacterium]|nr:SDR family oxidoreductase [Clostridia bacterium]